MLVCPPEVNSPTAQPIFRQIKWGIKTCSEVLFLSLSLLCMQKLKANFPGWRRMNLSIKQNKLQNHSNAPLSSSCFWERACTSEAPSAKDVHVLDKIQGEIGRNPEEWQTWCPAQYTQLWSVRVEIQLGYKNIQWGIWIWHFSVVKDKVQSWAEGQIKAKCPALNQTNHTGLFFQQALQRLTENRPVNTQNTPPKKFYTAYRAVCLTGSLKDWDQAAALHFLQGWCNKSLSHSKKSSINNGL